MSCDTMVSVVVPTKNCADSIEELMCSLEQQNYNNFEIIVVDSSDDRTHELALQHKVKTVRSLRLGLNIARNIGFSESSGEIICFTDGDCTMPKDWIKTIVLEFNRCERIGCVGGSVLSGNNNTFLGRYYSGALITVYPRYSKRHLITNSNAGNSPLGKVRFPAGCNIAFRREALEAIDGFNEEWNSTCEESEMISRLFDKGFVVSINPEIVVCHRNRESLTEAVRQAYTYGRGAGAFVRTGKKLEIGRRISSLAIASKQTFLHSANEFKEGSSLQVFLYPLLDIALGLSYYAGFLTNM
jgi:O-antigen biosynthesis protein